MNYFAAMHAFVRAVELGSFSKTAQESGLKVSTVSRHITSLETDLGAALFNRSTRRLHLTEAGRNFYEHASRILADLADARLAATALNARPQGLLRINVPIAFGRRHIFRHLPDFLEKYPEIRVDATLSDGVVDLIGSGTDVAIRIGALTDSSLVAKRLAPQRRVLVASPDYLASQRPIRKPKDLEDHECLSFALQSKEAWYFRPMNSKTSQLSEVAIRGRVRVNNSEALLDASLSHLGIALLPTWITYEAVAAGTLRVVLPKWEARIAQGPARAIWGVYPPKRVVPPKVRVFLSFMEARFGEPPYWDKATTSTK